MLPPSQAVLMAPRASNASTLTSFDLLSRAMFPGLAMTFASLAAMKVRIHRRDAITGC